MCNKDPLVSDTMNDLLIPCSSEAQGAIEMCWVDVPKDKLFETNVSMVSLFQGFYINKSSEHILINILVYFHCMCFEMY